MGNELSSLTTDDRQLQINQRRKAKAEKKARELLNQETSYDYSYQELIEKDFTGYMEAYVEVTKDVKTMTTRAKREVVLSLAKYDLLKGSHFYNIFCLKSKSLI